MDKFKIYIKNEILDAVEVCYDSYMKIKLNNNHTEIEAISNVIAIRSKFNWNIGKEFWLEKFKEEELVLNKIIYENKFFNK